MKIYNTLTKTIEEIKPHEEGVIRLYTCGPTVYNYAHIGNLRTYIFEDILEKSLRYLGYDVKRVMNITDVGHMTSDADTGEDKMIKESKKENKTVYEIADFYTKAFFADTEKLNIRKPDVVEKASDQIDYYIKMITKMLDEGYAYISNGNVYFDVTKAKDYYQLSGKNPDDLMVGVRDTVEEDTSKRNPFDFGLWFTLSKFENQDMKWDSPWGVGYPGWHIECSGISTKYLGEYLDIHCGGVDNIFPHHTNEIAQSEAYLGHKWCNYWVHMGFLNDQEGKMSKSKGEFLTVSLLEEKGYNPLDYRYLCLNSYYHNSLTFSYEILDGAKNAYNKLLTKTRSLTDDGEIKDYEEYINQFKDAIENDLNTSMMITILYDVLKDKALTDATKKYLVKEFDKVLSLDLLKQQEASISATLIDEINEKIKLRNEAKANKDYQTSDQIRDELLSRGIKLIDTREGTTFELIK